MSAKNLKSTIPRIGLLATGNELTEGDILNLDGQVIARTLTAQGFIIGLHVIAADKDDDLRSGLKFLLDSHEIVIITGGLGPTSDDRTRYALSHVLGKELVFDQASWQAICDRVQQRLGRAPHPDNRQQAFFPQGAFVIPNPNGTAAGCSIEYKNKLIYMLPGPPGECLPMFEEVVLPHLLSKISPTKQIKLSWQLKNAVESEVAALIDAAIAQYPASSGYRFYPPYLDVKIYTEQHDRYDEMIAVIRKIIDPYLSFE